MNNFKPMLCPNEVIDITTLKYPLLASYKLDGIRCIFKDGKMYSRALKDFPNVQLWNRFGQLARLAKEKNIILDGELLAKSLTFNELSGITRQLDKELPDDLFFYCFDCIINNFFNEPFADRFINAQKLITQIEERYAMSLSQNCIAESNDIQKLYEEALAWGCDGLILRDPKGRYKFGRGTIKEGLIYKMKPFQTFDAKIIGIIQSTEVREGAEKKINELGRSVTSKKKNDRVLIEKASAFVVIYKGKELKVTIAMTDEEKEEVWKNKKKYIGRMIEYKGMLVGAKENGLPRHPTFIRMRDDKGI
jgi:DNA ligase-1